MDEDFANHPKSLTEHKAAKTQGASDWTPRDVLVNVLRRIDAGELKFRALVLSGSLSDGDAEADGETANFYSVASPSLLLTLGMLTRTAHRIQRDVDRD